jgi:membrane-associated protease RseP (regulator of RpoE activity)
LVPALDSPNVAITFVRDGQRQTVSADMGWRLGRDTAAAIPELRTGDLVAAVDGTKPATFEEFRRMLAAPGSHVVRVDRNYFGYEITFPEPREVPASGSLGFLGIRPVPSGETERDRYSVAAALGAGAQQMGTLLGAIGDGFGRFLTPTGLSNYGSQVVEAVPGKPAAPANVKELGALPNAPADAKKPTDQPEDRPISIIGGTKLLGDGLEVGGLEVFLVLLATINLSLGVLNLLPLLPFDGGHAAVATYERIRSRRGREYRVDMAKLIPITYAVVFLFVLFGLSSMFLDIRNPVELP